MKVEIYTDFACPFCYIGKVNFEKALEIFPYKDKVKVIYKSFQLNPNAPNKQTLNSYEAFAKSHNMSLDKAKERLDSITLHAKNSGLNFRYDIMKMTNTLTAHRLYKSALGTDKEDQLMKRLLEGYFQEGKDLADLKYLTELAKELGLDLKKTEEVLNSDKYLEDVNEDLNDAHLVGINSVPFFVINGKYGVPGAQDINYFLMALNQIYEEGIEEEKDIKEEEDLSKMSCGLDGCEI